MYMYSYVGTSYFGIGTARNEVEMGTSSASAGDGSETLSDKDFPGSVFSHGVFVIRNGAFFSSALPQLEIGCAAPSVFLMAWSDPARRSTAPEHSLTAGRLLGRIPRPSQVPHETDV